MTTLLFLVATLVPLVFLERWIHRHLHGVALLLSGHEQVALYLYALLLFPGVALHELSHWLMAQVLRVKVGRLELLPRRAADGRVRLGSLQVQRADVVRASLIGVAPLLSGSLVVLAIGYLAFDVTRTGQALLSGNLSLMLWVLRDVLQTPDMWLWLYLLFAVANAMLPSPADRQTWPPVILFLGLIAVLAYLAGGPSLVNDTAPLLATGLRWLTIAFALTLAADVPFIALIALAEWGIGALRGQKVDYKSGR